AASRVLGANSWRTFRKIILPLSIPGVITAIVLTFAHTLGEFGVVLMVGGNLPGATRTVSISIYDHVQSIEYEEANQLALTLLAISFVLRAIVYGLTRRIGVRWLANCPRPSSASALAFRAARFGSTWISPFHPASSFFLALLAQGNPLFSIASRV